MSEEKKRRRRKPVLEETPVAVKAEVAPTEESIEESAEDDSEGFAVKRAPWLMRVDGLNLDVPLTSLKLPTFTTGMIDQGTLTIETVNIPEIALNSYFRTWLMKPLPRRLQLKIVDVSGKDVETWSMLAVPGAMGFSELDVQDDSPWVTQVAFSISEINIEPAK